MKQFSKAIAAGIFAVVVTVAYLVDHSTVDPAIVAGAWAAVGAVFQIENA
jgi:hypothetical protein